MGLDEQGEDPDYAIHGEHGPRQWFSGVAGRAGKDATVFPHLRLVLRYCVGRAACSLFLTVRLIFLMLYLKPSHCLQLHLSRRRPVFSFGPWSGWQTLW